MALTCQAYADWVASPQASSACPGLPEAVFQLVSDGLTSPEASFAAGPAMFHICDALTKANSPALPAVAPRVLAAVQAVQPAGELSRSGGAAAVLPVAEVDVLHVLKAAAVLARTLAEGQASELARVSLTLVFVPFPHCYLVVALSCPAPPLSHPRYCWRTPSAPSRPRPSSRPSPKAPGSTTWFVLWPTGCRP